MSGPPLHIGDISVCYHDSCEWVWMCRWTAHCVCQWWAPSCSLGMGSSGHHDHDCCPLHGRGVPTTSIYKPHRNLFQVMHRTRKEANSTLWQLLRHCRTSLARAFKSRAKAMSVADACLPVTFMHGSAVISPFGHNIQRSTSSFLLVPLKNPSLLRTSTDLLLFHSPLQIVSSLPTSRGPYFW